MNVRQIDFAAQTIPFSAAVRRWFMARFPAFRKNPLSCFYDPVGVFDGMQPVGKPQLLKGV